jgi:hypothetical protein
MIWERLGDVENYVEPFAGSLAVMLNRPTPAQTETVNDADRFVANFWRAMQSDADAVAVAADNPVNEADLEARHQWLVTEGKTQLANLLTDPAAFDARIAGWWVWGQCAWIGSGWCSGEGPWRVVGGEWCNLRNAGQGVNRKLPHLGDAGKAHPHREHLIAYMRSLADRLRYVRVACGDWRRVLTPSITFRHGVTGVVLDPPYGEGIVDYSAGGNESTSIANEVRDWAIENGDNPDLRIALCGYDGQHNMPDSWGVGRWKAAGGYSSTAAGETEGKRNRHRETVWFSPHCLPVASDELLIA